MTTASIARSDAGSIDAGAEWTVGGVAKALGRGFKDYLAYHATLAELRSLTNKQLSDAGMSRDALERIALKAVYGN